jgi:hypothetical protein
VRVPKDSADVLAKRWGCSPADAVLRAVAEATERR